MDHLKHSDVSQEVRWTPCYNSFALQTFDQTALCCDPHLMKRDVGLIALNLSTPGTVHTRDPRSGRRLRITDDFASQAHEAYPSQSRPSPSCSTSRSSLALLTTSSSPLPHSLCLCTSRWEISTAMRRRRISRRTFWQDAGPSPTRSSTARW